MSSYSRVQLRAFMRAFLTSLSSLPLVMGPASGAHQQLVNFRRRQRAVIVSFLLACVAFAAIGASAHAAEIAVKQPNILFIVTDDQRVAGTVDLLNSNGSYWMNATNFWFRTNGTTFPDGYVPTPLCCPSRASIFTGRYPHNHKVQSDEEGFKLGTTDATGSDPGEQPTTLQSYLQGAGYTTGIVGKYLNHWDLSKAPPYFNNYWIFDGGYGNSVECQTTCTLDVNENGTRNMSLSAYSTTWINDKALQFIDTHHSDSNPWFLYVAPYAPHLDAPGGGYGEIAETEPAHASDPVPDDSYLNHPAMSYLEPDMSDKPPWLRDDHTKWTTGAKVVTARRSQLRSLKSVDDMVRNIMRKLQDYGQVRDTLAVFISDNGYLWGEHNIGPPPGGGIPGKGEPYPESIKVPFFARWPNAPAGSRFELPKGGTDRRPVTTVDLASTGLDAVNATTSAPPIVPNPAMDGRSLFDRTWLRTRLFTEFWRINDGIYGAPANLTIPPWAADRYFKLYQTGLDPSVYPCAQTVVNGFDINCPLYQYDFQFNEYYPYVNPAGCVPPSPNIADCAPDYANPSFREYYDAATDSEETQNAYGPDGYPGTNPATGMNDDRPIPNQLSWEYLTAQLARDRNCSGTDYSTGHACP